MIPVIQISNMQIPTFFLVISISLSCVLILLSYRVDDFKKDRKIAFDLALHIMVASLIGARLMHVFYEEWDYYLNNPLLIFYFWQGGFAYFGGLVLSVIAGFIYTRYRKINFLEWADFFTPIASLGHALGRVGCYLSGCCFGSECLLPWAYDGKHPTALYLAGGEFIIFLLLLFVEKKQLSKFSGGLFVKWLLLHSLLRFNVEYFRNDFRGLFINFPVLGSLSISQIISLVIIIGCLGFYYKNRKKLL